MSKINNRDTRMTPFANEAKCSDGGFYKENELRNLIILVF